MNQFHSQYAGQTRQGMSHWLIEDQRGAQKISKGFKYIIC